MENKTKVLIADGVDAKAIAEILASKGFECEIIGEEQMSEQKEKEKEDKKIVLIGSGCDGISSAIAKAMIEEQKHYMGINIEYKGNDDHCWWQQYQGKRKKNRRY